MPGTGCPQPGAGPVHGAVPGLHGGLPGGEGPVVVGGGEAGKQGAAPVVSLLQVERCETELHQWTVSVLTVINHHQVDAGGFELDCSEAD